MRYDAVLALFGSLLWIGSAGCTTADRPAVEGMNQEAQVAEVPVIPDGPPPGSSPEPARAPGAPAVLDGTAAPGMRLPDFISTYPGEFAFRTRNGYYLTAINGGGRTDAPTIITSATAAGTWEKFRLAIAAPPSAYDKTIQTDSGNYVTAVNGGGMTVDVLHTDATQARDWERFRLVYLGANAPTYYGIGTTKGNFLTAVAAGGRYDDPLHSDARQIRSWEQFRIVKCGDPGSSYEYAILAADGEFLASSTYQGQTWFSLTRYPSESEMKLKLINQADGTFSLQTAGGTYLTALGGGGQVEKYDSKYWTPGCGGLFGGPCVGGAAPIFHIDATQVQAWEKFRVIDQGNCTYALQTTSGFYAGIFKDRSGVTLVTTRRDSPATANEKFQLVVFGLASPPIIQ